MSDSSKNVVTQEYLDIIKSYRPMDDAFMRNIFRESPDIAEMVLRIVMDKPDLKVIRSETQVDLKRITGSRGLCLDVLATDSSGKKYDIEVQRSTEGADPDRARYHASAMDVENSWQGMKFRELPEIYVIFITEEDIFGYNDPVYEFATLEKKRHFPLNDRRNILYVNGQYRDSTDMGKLMHDFNCSDPDDMLIPVLANRTRYLKTDEKEVKLMCEQMEKLKAEGKAEGIAEGVSIGEYNTKKAASIRMYKKGQNVEDIADSLEVNVELVKQWIEENK